MIPRARSLQALADRGASIELSDGRTVARSASVSAATTTQPTITAAGQAQAILFRIFVSLYAAWTQTSSGRRYSGVNSREDFRSGHVRRMSRRQVRSVAMSVRGVITSRHVLTHAALIVREFGMTAFLRCCLAIVQRKNTTFLECLFPDPRLT